MGRSIMIVWFLLVCCTVLCVGYSTSGNEILDPNGHPILLRGVVRPSLEWSSTGQYLSLADYTLMKAWGSNVVRLSLSQCYWLDINSQYDSTYIATVAQQVTWIKSLGMGVILDLHWSNQGSSSVSCAQQAMADSHSTDFWSAVATKYANDPSVIFELYNEPYVTSWAVWKNGGDTGNGFNTPGMQSLYNTVRGTGANNLVLIGGINYAFDLSGLPQYAITGTNIAYNTHPYGLSGKMPGNWASAFGFLAPTYPLIATEFGEYDCNSTYISEFVSYADSLSMSWTAWAWWNGGCGFPGLITDWSGDASADGLVVKAELTNGPKVPPTTSAAATTRAPTTTTTSHSTTAASTSHATTAASTSHATTAASTSHATTAASTSHATTTSTSHSATTGGSTTGTSPNTIPVYTESVLSPFLDYSWGTYNAQDGSYHEGSTGSYSFSFVPADWSAAYFFYQGGIDTTKYTSIQFWINGGPTGGQNVFFDMIKYSGSTSTETGTSQSVNVYTGKSSIAANTWVQGTVSLSLFPVEIYDGFWFQDQSGTNTQGTVYLDNIYLI